MEKFRYISQEVYYNDGPLCRVTMEEIECLKTTAKKLDRQRVRLCAHPNETDLLHEMLIVHCLGNYIPPHRHQNKSESFHVIEGEADVVLFDDNGNPTDLIEMGALDSKKNFFYRLSEPVFHSLIIRSEFFVFHEVTNGPFDREEMFFAPWAPLEEEWGSVKDYQNKLNQLIEDI